MVTGELVKVLDKLIMQTESFKQVKTKEEKKTKNKQNKKTEKIKVTSLGAQT